MYRIVVSLAASSPTAHIPISVLPTTHSHTARVFRAQSGVSALRPFSQMLKTPCRARPVHKLPARWHATSCSSGHLVIASASAISPRSVVCQQSSLTRSRPRHAASAPSVPAAATAAAAAAALLLLLCNGCLLILFCCLPRCTPSLNCYCADTSITMHATNDLSSSLPLLSFVTSFAVSTHLHDSSDILVSTFQSDATPSPSSDGLPGSVRLGFALIFTLPDLVTSCSHKYLNSTCRVFPRPLLDAIALAALESVQIRTWVVTPKSAIIDCIPSPLLHP